jgi:hypothetical protein
MDIISVLIDYIMLNSSMSTKPKKKLCWNCEGNVSVKEVMCPYCGVSLHPSTNGGKEGQKDHLNPPYKLVNPAHEQHIPLPLYAPTAEETEESEPEKEVDQEEEKNHSKLPLFNSATEASKVVITLALLIGGSIFFIFSLALLLFSDEGYLTLRWNGSFWFVYLLISIPMLIYGWKFIQTLDDSKEL